MFVLRSLGSRLHKSPHIFYDVCILMKRLSDQNLKWSIKGSIEITKVTATAFYTYAIFVLNDMIVPTSSYRHIHWYLCGAVAISLWTTIALVLTKSHRDRMSAISMEIEG